MQNNPEQQELTAAFEKRGKVTYYVEDMLFLFNEFYDIIATFENDGIPEDNSARDKFFDDIKTQMAMLMETYYLEPMDLKDY